MAQLLVRDLDENTVLALKRRAETRRRSLAQEVRLILEEATEGAESDRPRGHGPAHPQEPAGSGDPILRQRGSPGRGSRAVRRLVVDASVAIKWYVPEVHSEAAARVLDERAKGVRLQVPDLFFPEFGNILWRKVRVGEIEKAVAEGIAGALLAVPKTVHRSEALLPSALNIALNAGQTL